MISPIPKIVMNIRLSLVKPIYGGRQSDKNVSICLTASVKLMILANTNDILKLLFVLICAFIAQHSGQHDTHQCP